MKQSGWKIQLIGQVDGRLCAFLVAALVLLGCSEKALPPADVSDSVVILASNERGRPQFDYSGPDSLSYSYNLNAFEFQIGQQVRVKGEMKLGRSNDVTISIQSTSDRPFGIMLLGLSPTNNLDTEEEKLKEIVRIPRGKQVLKIERFIIFTHDFIKR